MRKQGVNNSDIQQPDVATSTSQHMVYFSREYGILQFRFQVRIEQKVDLHDSVVVLSLMLPWAASKMYRFPCMVTYPPIQA